MICRSVDIPFTSERYGRIVHETMRADKEPVSSGLKKAFALNGSTLTLYVDGEDGVGF